MSIASNVIDENSKLGLARTLMREKLAANGIYYNNHDSIFQLVRRWNLKYADVSFNTPYSSEIYAGAEITVGATVTDSSTDDPISGMPVTIIMKNIFLTNRQSLCHDVLHLLPFHELYRE